MHKLSTFITLSDGVSNRFFPLGARYIIKIIEDNNHEVLFLQDRIISRENILTQIKHCTPCLIWISIQPSVQNLFNFLQDISKVYFGTIILGNIGSRWITEKQLTTLKLNIIIVSGQGEDATKELINLENKNLLNLKYIQNISNIYGYIDNKYFRTKPEKTVDNQNIIPSSNGLKEAISRGDIITIRTSSGCNFHCTFCSVKDINNGQEWKQFKNNILLNTLQNIVNHGMINGILRFIDDDTAVSLDYLLEISETFKKINIENNTNIKFGFATNAIHLYNPNDTLEEKEYRIFIWNKVVQNGLTDLFLGLESGSDTQLKRLGKNTNTNINYKAYDFAITLKIDLEIGFIPIDPLMKDIQWKEEFLDNIKLAKYIKSYLSSPTWLATVRVYENSPLKRALLNNNLLNEKIKYSNEYKFSYFSTEVQEFIFNLGICLCDDDINNGLYKLKRELKNIIRYDIQHSKEFIQLIKIFSYNLSNLEFLYIEKIIQNNDISIHKYSFIQALLLLLSNIQSKLKDFKQEAYYIKVIESLEMAKETINEWRNNLMIKEPITNAGYEKLAKEIKKFKKIEIPDVIEDIRVAASYGDLTENAEYEAATERQGFLLARLASLQQLLSKLVIIDPSENNHTKVSFGSTFEIINIDTDEKFVYTLMGGYESNPTKGKISYNSPLAKSFIGKEVDDEIKVTLNNNVVYYEIEKIYFDENSIKLEEM